jgi:hypothetical protein
MTMLEAGKPVVVSEAQILEYGLQTLKTPNRKHDGRDIRWQIVSEHRSRRWIRKV